MTLPLVSDPDNGSGGELCTSCGLCCAGALHDWARLEREEVEWAKAIGLPVDAQRLRFDLPCPKLVDRKCGIYDHRPAVCPGYRCQLLRDCDAGLVDLPAGLALVAQARELFSAAVAATTDGNLGEARRRARDLPMAEITAMTGAARAAALAERLRILALEVFLDRHFRRPKEGMAYRALEGSGDMQVEEAGQGHGKS